MDRIASFNVDHTRLLPGIYISRIDGDIVTYDIRIKKPNTRDLMANNELHSIEHLVATALRNSDEADKVIYFGPMGCQTGYYCLMRVSSDFDFVGYFKNILRTILVDFDSMPGCSAEECGNYRNLSLDLGKEAILSYLDLFSGFDSICSYPES